MAKERERETRQKTSKDLTKMRGRRRKHIKQGHRRDGKKGEEGDEGPTKKQRQEEEEADATTKGQSTQGKTGEEHGFPVLYP